MTASAKELFKNIYFILCLVATIICLIVTILVGLDHSPSVSKGWEFDLFLGTHPAFLIVLMGIIITYIEEAHDPYNLEMLYYLLGAVLFLLSVILQVVAGVEGSTGMMIAIFSFVNTALLIAESVLTIWKKYC